MYNVVTNYYEIVIDDLLFSRNSIQKVIHRRHLSDDILTVSFAYKAFNGVNDAINIIDYALDRYNIIPKWVDGAPLHRLTYELMGVKVDIEESLASNSVDNIDMTCFSTVQYVLEKFQKEGKRWGVH